MVCPSSLTQLEEVDREKVLGMLGFEIRRLDASRVSVNPNDVTQNCLRRVDGVGAYPLVEGIPMLMAPEMLTNTENITQGRADLIDTNADPYREAYAEMDFYNSEADSSRSDIVKSASYRNLSKLVDFEDFPSREWLDATYDSLSQADAYRFISPVREMRTLQLGGSGREAVKFLLAGARESWLLTPMLSEALFGRALANAFGVGEKFKSIVGIAEKMPFADSTFDRVYSSGCIHHTVTDLAFPEVRRVLKSGGRFAAVEPWRAPAYRLGTRILGQRESPLFGRRDCGVICRPMEAERIAPLFLTFDDAEVRHHGTFTRYPLLALSKLGVKPRIGTVDRIMRTDDKFASRVSSMRHGSSVALLAESR